MPKITEQDSEIEIIWDTEEGVLVFAFDRTRFVRLEDTSKVGLLMYPHDARSFLVLLTEVLKTIDK